MEKRISPEEERRLTHSIEKAASLALVDDKADRSSLLARCLLGDGVDSRFSKVASAAFNKRLSVLKFQHTPDDKRGETFAISDPGRVHELMGGEKQKKTASVSDRRGPFAIKLVSGAPMSKAAKEAKAAECIPYEYRVDASTLEDHVGSILDKLAAEHQDSLAEIRNLEGRLAREKTAIVGELRKLASFDLQTLYNVYGEPFKRAFSDSLHEFKFVKTASAVNPGSRLSVRVGKFLSDRDAYTDKVNDMSTFQRCIDGFSITASNLGGRLHKVAAGGLLAGIVARGIYGVGASAMSNVKDTLSAGADAYGVGLSNAKKMMDAAGYERENPANAVDPKLLARDRYLDNLLAISDASADSVIAQYPFKEMFLTANDVLQIPGMSEPKNRNLFKATLAETLARKGRMGLADVAQISSIRKDQEKAGETDVYKAMQSVSNLEKDAPIAADIDMKGYTDAVTKERKDKISDIWKGIKEENKADIKDYLEANKNKDKDGGKNAEKMLNDMHIKIDRDPVSGKLVFYQQEEVTGADGKTSYVNSRILGGDEISEMISEYKALKEKL